EPSPDILYSMGVIARIGQVQRGLGGVQLLLQGEQRATSLQYTTTDNYLAAVVVPVEEMNPLDEHDPAFEALHKEARERAAELGEKRGLLETLSVEERLRRVLVHVQRQIGLLEAQEEIKSQVQEELGQRQREM